MADDKNRSRESDSDLSETEGAFTLDEIGDMYDDANAVLGASDPDNCSYSLGYVKRQALYACVTCIDPKAPDAEMAGICLACANKCHENHQLVELYTKRVFRCDCGNKKFETPCQLQPEKDHKNSGNAYNHNFVGLYCTCDRPYPDPEDDDEMIQCIVCEDWFHSRHSLGHHSDKTIIGDGSDVDCEMICAKCTESCDFLKFYGHLRVPVTIKPESASTSLNEEAKTESNLKPETSGEHELTCNKTNEMKIEIDGDSCAGLVCQPSPQLPTTTIVETKTESSQETRDSGIVLTDSGEESAEVNGADGGKKTCLLKSNQRVQLPGTATLWAVGWRSKLCTCESCLNTYFKCGVGYITDDEDTLFAYEAIGQEKLEKEEKEKEEEFTNMWDKLDHVAKVEAINSFNEMKEHLKEFLLKHNGKVVRRKDAEEFAEELKAKRAKRSHDGIPPSSCR